MESEEKAIQPGETFKYEYTVWQHGTYTTHSHHDEIGLFT